MTAVLELRPYIVDGVCGCCTSQTEEEQVWCCAQVTSTRKGLRNQLKTLLWRKQPGAAAGSAAGRDSPRGSLAGSMHGGSVHGGSAAAAAAANGSAGYGGGTVEGQMRALADLAFMMQVHRTALLHHCYFDSFPALS